MALFLGLLKFLPSDPKYRDVFEYPDFETVELDEDSYLPSGFKFEVHKDMLSGIMKSIDPVVKALETALFAVPGPEGIAAAAAAGLVWEALQLPVTLKYTAPIRDVFTEVVKKELQLEALQKARRDLEEFNDNIAASINKVSPDMDAGSILVIDEANRFKNYVYPGGIVCDAVRSIIDNLLWFDSTTHSLLICAFQAVLQSHMMGVMLWKPLAISSRKKGDIDGYNRAQYEMFKLLDHLGEDMKNLGKRLRSKIKDMQTKRLHECKVVWTDAEVSRTHDHRTHNGQDKYHVEGSIEDPATKKQLLRVTLKGASTLAKVGDGVVFVMVRPLHWSGWFKPGGEQDDGHFGLVMDEALHQYQTRLLPRHFDKPFEALLEGISQVGKQTESIFKLCSPLKPTHGPVFIPEHFIPDTDHVLNDIPVGSEFSLRFTLDDWEGNVAQSSPWSEWVKRSDDGMIQQAHIGDGYARIITHREIYYRTSPDDEVGKKLGSIAGLGILTWPLQPPQPAKV